MVTLAQLLLGCMVWVAVWRTAYWERRAHEGEAGGFRGGAGPSRHGHAGRTSHSLPAEDLKDPLAPAPAKYRRVFNQRAAYKSCRAGGGKGGGKTVLITGTGGFVGFHTALKLRGRGDRVVGLDNFNSYYDTALKRDRQRLLEEAGVYTVEGDLNDGELLQQVLDLCEVTHVLHLAAQAGVRYATKNPMAYVDSNLSGMVKLLEVLKATEPMPRLVFASSSSVYGLNQKVPFSEADKVDRPASLYAATKKADEMMSHVYFNIYGLSVTALRFFTVYGPYGRPDMAYFFFTEKILKGEEIQIFQGPNGEELARDFTYIDDIVAGVVGSLDTAPPSGKGEAAYRIFNLGNTRPETVSNFVETLEDILGRKANKRFVTMPPTGDVIRTHANVTAARQAFGYTPQTSLREGLAKFVAWYQDYYPAPYEESRRSTFKS